MARYILHPNSLVKLKRERSAPSTIHAEVEIIYVVKGSFRALSEGNVYDLSEGDIFVAFPFVDHAYEAIGDNLTFLAIFDPILNPRLSATFTEFRPVNPVISTRQLSPGFGELLLRIHELAAANGSFNNADNQALPAHDAYLACRTSKETVDICLTAAMSELLDELTLEKRSSNDFVTVSRVVSYCVEHYREPTLTLETTAKAVGLSRGYIIRVFGDKIGIKFTDFIHRLRADRAIWELYRSPKSISEIAFECGFPTIRSFNRVFSESFGMTPSEYRKSGIRPALVQREISAK